MSTVDAPPEVDDDPDFYPADFQPPPRAKGANGELATAAAKGRMRPGIWVKVGPPRALIKPPHNWLSEVRLGQKDELRGETWEADFDPTGEQDEDGKPFYQKRIRLVITGKTPER